MPTLDPSEYRVGWICALPVEGAAAIAMLDERHDGPVSRHPSDHNSYTLGKIGQHNVVIACLPYGRTGTNDAAITAANLAYCFESVKIHLMVGIAGGVPSAKHDIRLGDVVVSKPGSKGGGVIQYDRGRTSKDGEFHVTHTVDSTAPQLLSAFSAMQMRQDVDGNTFARHLTNIPETMKSKYAYPGEDLDKLFEENYEHVGGEACERCDIDRLVKRDCRPSREPLVHYGTVLSANRVMMDAPTREQLRKQFKAECFEMEAAGLMSHFRCAVIRGIADYSDSHKNAIWQPYAALAAAAYAKELLGLIPPERSASTSSSPPRSNTSVPQVLSSPLTHTPDNLRDTSTENSPTLYQPERVPHGHRLPGISSTSFFVFNEVLLPPKSVALGRLVISTKVPWLEFCPYIGEATKEETLISRQPRIREIVESVKGTELYEKLKSRYSLSLTEEDSFFGSTTEKTYLLLNSGNWFKDKLGDPRTRKWIETVISRRWCMFLAVGIHVVSSSSVSRARLERQLKNVELSLECDEISACEEFIVSVQYRKVQIDWHTSSNVDSAFLEMECNRWEVYCISREGDEEEDEDDIIEATLKETIVKEDVMGEGETFAAGGQIIVL